MLCDYRTYNLVKDLDIEAAESVEVLQLVKVLAAVLG
jgi:hypothetical protein